MPKSKESIRVPYGLSVHGPDEIKAVVEVLKGNTALGKRTEEFEQKIAKMFGKKYGVMVNSGSSANLLAFELLNLPKGSEVITPLLTFATTLTPIIQKGLVPVFVDVDLDTFVVNPQAVKKAISKKTRALMIPSLLGSVPNLKALASLARKHKLWLIEDSCDTLGARFAGRPTGKYSHISTTSFYGSHIINGAGGGGMICVNDPAWRQRLVVLRGWGRASSVHGEKQKSEQLKHRFRKSKQGLSYDAKFTFSEVGYNFLPLEISSAFALVQLKKFKQFKAARKKNFSRLFNFFQSYQRYFVLPQVLSGVNTTWLAFPLTIKANAPFSRQELIGFLERGNIQTRPVFTGNILKHPAFRKISRRTMKTGYPNTELIMQNAFMIGCHQGLTQRQLNYLEQKVRDFLKKFD
jgi:CDP-6-deoxy-D-xylo-4-hexulose-3-dehydrase